MKQDENEQNYKKGPTPVVGKKPNGKSQFKCIEALNRRVFVSIWQFVSRRIGRKAIRIQRNIRISRVQIWASGALNVCM
jgi:hypothetical protein